MSAVGDVHHEGEHRDRGSAAEDVLGQARHDDQTESADIEGGRHVQAQRGGLGDAAEDQGTTSAEP